MQNSRKSQVLRLRCFQMRVILETQVTCVHLGPLFPVRQNIDRCEPGYSRWRLLASNFGRSRLKYR